MALKNAVEHAARYVTEFWKTGALSGHWEDGAWSVTACCSLDDRDNESHFIPFFGPGVDGDRFRADVRPHLPGYDPPPQPKMFGELSASLRRLQSARSVFIKYVNCNLFYPGKNHPHAWARAQIGVWALQRPWQRTEDDEAWVWTDCLVPVLKLTKAGRSALEDSAVIGYELLAALKSNYVNPIRPGGFQLYIRNTVKRATARENRKHHPRPRPQDRFDAFLRQRRRRGHPGIVLDQRGRLDFVSESVGNEIKTEYAEIIARRDFIARLSAKMVEDGANESSARRQVRRWLQETACPQATEERYLEWKGRRRGKGK